ncbi:type II secretion system F family protein [Actinoplanes sp. N902-109]|uniref:type II secretion system F family protein n=1 Tax=Actinoplanes sp. (strain N902-109) TaxID=649831 RepID=UPI0003296234|nr:type II secretion system F family protein [Actinoplanes sp. N902-109]AGL13966.1 type II secretion system protein [Actinoplanes sp. N902-109]
MRRRALLAAGCGASIIWYVGEWWGVLLAVAVGYGLDQLLKRQEPAAARAVRERAESDLPLAADLLAAALRTGIPVDAAVAAVAEALGGALGDRLARVGRAVHLGAAPPEAWAHLGGLAGAERLVAAAVRASTSGAAFAGALTRLADDLRTDRALAAEAAARRAGVLLVLPLGMCFLPAFLLAGLVPVIVAVLGDVL